MKQLYLITTIFEDDRRAICITDNPNTNKDKINKLKLDLFHEKCFLQIEKLPFIEEDKDD